MMNSINMKETIDNSKPELQQVDSQDIPEPTKPIFQQLLHSMNPSSCLQPATSMVADCQNAAYKSCLGSEKEELEWLLPGIIDSISSGGKSRTDALHRLYRLTDREHIQNRVTLVCSSKFEIIPKLVLCLDNSANPNDRRQALLILNNMCIPIENKPIILFGEHAETLLSALLNVIRERMKESYLATVCLLNLSYTQDDHAKAMLLTFVPLTTGSASSQFNYKFPIDNPHSLLRTLESLLKDSVAFVRHTGSVEYQCCRWSINVIRNLVTLQSNALIVGTKTEFPMLVAECLRSIETINLQKWTRDSLEDASLMFFVHICKVDDCLESLSQSLIRQVSPVCEELVKQKGIHKVSAMALLERFDELKSSHSVGFSV